MTQFELATAKNLMTFPKVYAPSYARGSFASRFSASEVMALRANAANSPFPVVPYVRSFPEVYQAAALDMLGYVAPYLAIRDLEGYAMDVLVNDGYAQAESARSLVPTLKPGWRILKNGTRQYYGQTYQATVATPLPNPYQAGLPTWFNVSTALSGYHKGYYSWVGVNPVYDALGNRLPNQFKYPLSFETLQAPASVPSPFTWVDPGAFPGFNPQAQPFRRVALEPQSAPKAVEVLEVTFGGRTVARQVVFDPPARPPGRNEKERKHKGFRGAVALFKAIEDFGDAMQITAAFYQAARSRYGSDKVRWLPWSQASWAQRMQGIEYGLTHGVDWADFGSSVLSWYAKEKIGAVLYPTIGALTPNSTSGDFLMHQMQSLK